MHLALATCADPASADAADEVHLVAALRRAGVEPVWADWRDPGVDWGSFDGVVIRTTWDYTGHVPAFVAWAEAVGRVTRLLNPASVVRWNVDKAYLRDLADHGVAGLPTVVLARGSDPDRALRAALEGAGAHLLLKPAIGAGAAGTLRVSAADRASQAAARDLLAAWLPRTAMFAQPYVDVERTGETSVMCFGGVPYHAVVKHPPPGSWKVQTEHGGRTRGIALDPSLVDVATRALHAAGAHLGLQAPLAFARVDLLPFDGTWRLLELEAIEPALYLAHGEGAADAAADAMLRAVGSSPVG